MQILADQLRTKADAQNLQREQIQRQLDVMQERLAKAEIRAEQADAEVLAMQSQLVTRTVRENLLESSLRKSRDELKECNDARQGPTTAPPLCHACTCQDGLPTIGSWGAENYGLNSIFSKLSSQDTFARLGFPFKTLWGRFSELLPSRTAAPDDDFLKGTARAFYQRFWNMAYRISVQYSALGTMLSGRIFDADPFVEVSDETNVGARKMFILILTLASLFVAFCFRKCMARRAQAHFDAQLISMRSEVRADVEKELEAEWMAIRKELEVHAQRILQKETVKMIHASTSPCGLDNEHMAQKAVVAMINASTSPKVIAEENLAHKAVAIEVAAHNRANEVVSEATVRVKSLAARFEHEAKRLQVAEESVRFAKAATVPTIRIGCDLSDSDVDHKALGLTTSFGTRRQETQKSGEYCEMRGSNSSTKVAERISEGMPQARVLLHRLAELLQSIRDVANISQEAEDLNEVQQLSPYVSYPVADADGEDDVVGLPAVFSIGEKIPVTPPRCAARCKAGGNNDVEKAQHCLRSDSDDSREIALREFAAQLELLGASMGGLLVQVFEPNTESHDLVQLAITSAPDYLINPDESCSDDEPYIPPDTEMLRSPLPGEKINSHAFVSFNSGDVTEKSAAGLPRTPRDRIVMALEDILS